MMGEEALMVALESARTAVGGSFSSGTMGVWHGGN